MNNNNWAYAFTIALLALVIAALVLRQPVAAPLDEPKAGTTFGDNSYLEESASLVYPGNQADTLIAATNTSRTHLRIYNMSSTSAQTLYCNVNDAPSALYFGYVVNASSSITLENYRGALRCKFPTATSGISIIQR
jgi:hypothetical protein